MRYCIGVDLGGTNIAVGLVDENYNIVKKSSVPTNVARGADAIVADISALPSEAVIVRLVQKVRIQGDFSQCCFVHVVLLSCGWAGVSGPVGQAVSEGAIEYWPRGWMVSAPR